MEINNKKKTKASEEEINDMNTMKKARLSEDVGQTFIDISDSSDYEDESENEYERYEKKIEILKKTEKYHNTFFFPLFNSENIDTDTIAVSYELRQDEPEYTYFECSICDICLKEEFKLGHCMMCMKPLGLCCYSDEWMVDFDSIERPPHNSDLLCSLYIEHEL